MDLSEVQARTARRQGHARSSSIAGTTATPASIPLPITYPRRRPPGDHGRAGLRKLRRPAEAAVGLRAHLRYQRRDKPDAGGVDQDRSPGPLDLRGRRRGQLAAPRLWRRHPLLQCRPADDPRVFACGNWDAGLRVYDIRNPWQPKEVAYFDRADGGVPGWRASSRRSARSGSPPRRSLPRAQRAVPRAQVPGGRRARSGSFRLRAHSCRGHFDAARRKLRVRCCPFARPCSADPRSRAEQRSALHDGARQRAHAGRQRPRARCGRSAAAAGARHVRDRAELRCGRSWQWICEQAIDVSGVIADPPLALMADGTHGVVAARPAARSSAWTAAAAGSAPPSRLLNNRGVDLTLDPSDPSACCS